MIYPDHASLLFSTKVRPRDSLESYSRPCHSVTWHRTPSSLTLAHPALDRENRVTRTEQLSVAWRAKVQAINSSPCSNQSRRTEETSFPSFVWYGVVGNDDSSPAEP